MAKQLHMRLQSVLVLGESKSGEGQLLVELSALLGDSARTQRDQMRQNVIISRLNE
jgi:hypothetical protein